MTEVRKLFSAEDGTFWMELYPHEVEHFKEHPELVRFFSEIPCSQVVIKREKRAEDFEEDYRFGERGCS